VILASSFQPLYYLHTMSDPKKSRREVLEAFVAEKPDDAFSRYGLALEYLNSGDTRKAEGQFRELLQRNPGYVPGYQMLGQLLAKQSRSEDARSILAQGIAVATKAGNGHAQAEMESLLAEL
jgi:Tfp pilus assembly protein PilF